MNRARTDFSQKHIVQQGFFSYTQAQLDSNTIYLVSGLSIYLRKQENMYGSRLVAAYKLK